MLSQQICKTRYTLSTVKVFTVIASFIMATLSFAAPVNDVRAIFVGHSLINYDMPHILKQLVEDAENLTIENSVQVINGAPLRYNWDNCYGAQFTGEWPPASFACDEIDAGTSEGAYNTLIVTDANNSIHSNHEWNHPQLHINNFLELMKDKDAHARAFLFTSWEGLDYHSGEWTDAIDAELAEYEQVIEEATQISVNLGRNAHFELIPANLALRELVLNIENGQINGLSGRTDIFVDDVHMNGIGNYFMANVVFSAIYKQSPAGLTSQVSAKNYDPIIVETSLALQLQQLAWTVVNGYSSGGTTTVNEAPDAVISLPLEAQTIEVGDRLTFSAVANDPNGDTALTYLWDFDGIAQSQTSLTSSSILFDRVGSFNISFLVTDSFGLADPSPATIQITVEEPRLPNNAPDTQILSPIEAQNLKVGDSLVFIGSASDADGDTSLTYQWHFGGAAPIQTSETTTPIVFSETGNFEITFTALDSLGLADPTPATIMVLVENIAAIETISNFAATEIAQTNVSTLSWTSPSVSNPIESYNVIVNDVITSSTTGNATSFELTLPDNEQVYQVRLDGIDASGTIVAQSTTIDVVGAVIGLANGRQLM